MFLSTVYGAEGYKVSYSFTDSDSPIHYTRGTKVTDLCEWEMSVPVGRMRTKRLKGVNEGGTVATTTTASRGREKKENLLKKIIKDEMNEEEKKYFGKEEKKMEEEEDNNNSDSDSETTEGESDAESEEDEESEGGHKDSKRGSDDNVDDHLVAEEKDNPFEVPNDELEAQFNACVMRHRIDKIKKGRKCMDSDDDDNDDSNEESNDENCESTKGQTQEMRKRGRPPKKKIKTKQCH